MLYDEYLERLSNCQSRLLKRFSHLAQINESGQHNEDLRKKIYDKHISAFLDEMQENNEDFIKDIPVPTYDLKKKTMEMVDKLIAKSIDINSRLNRYIGDMLIYSTLMMSI